jgi:hypothetical protein
MVINKTGGDLSSPLNLKGFSGAADAQVYTYGPANLSAIVSGPEASISAGQLVHTYPASSITLLVIPKA